MTYNHLFDNLFLFYSIKQQNQMQQLQRHEDADSQANYFNYRKIYPSGSTAIASFRYTNQKLFPKQFHFQVPLKQIKEERMPITIKIVEDDYYKKYKLQSGIKSLLKAYEQNRRRNSSQGMNKLGLDVIKIKSFSSNNKNGNIIQPNTSMRKISSKNNVNIKNSVKKIQTNFIINRQILSPLKHMVQERLEENQDLIFSTKEIKNSFHSNQEQLHKNISENHLDYLQEAQHDDKLLIQKRYKKQRRVEEYLYKRLEGTQNKIKMEQNYIYDKRIKSYTDFLWKNQISHNIYINLDLKIQQNLKSKRLKAYIAVGNNGAMIKGILKRRFWWMISDQRTNDCDFVWTQIKSNEILSNQKASGLNKARLKNEQQEQQQIEMLKTSKLKLSKLKKDQQQLYLAKVLNKKDMQIYKNYHSKYQSTYFKKQRDYNFKCQKINKYLIHNAVEEHHTIHNHLENNFYLGNKKALFYNLKQYYTLIKQDLYNYVPLTFHIRKGVKDPQYHKFIQFYKKRAKAMQKEKKQYEQATKHKIRNIWIVKPGQNSNQGRGITVIDEIYELNSILKQSQRSQKIHNTQSINRQQTQHTYIVQMYIDRPMLYNNRKFDIRHYMMISNFFGITRAYWYEQGYIRTSSYQFDINNFEPQIHLTNDAVQKKYPEYHKYQPFNKISYEEFQRYLDLSHNTKKYNFKQQILPQMKKMATDTVRSVYTKISPRNLLNNFQIFGLDFMIDKNFKPWLIEINTNPCLQCSCPLLNKIIPYMIEQSFKLTLDLAYPPPYHYPNTSKHYAPLICLQTFKYELIFDSQVSGEQLLKLYRRVRNNNLIDQIGQIQQDEQFKDNGKQCRLDDFT